MDKGFSSKNGTSGLRPDRSITFCNATDCNDNESTSAARVAPGAIELMKLVIHQTPPYLVCTQ
jgi:hypothetical protein